MTSRREFLSALSSLGLTALGSRRNAAGDVPPGVTAKATIFHGHPNGRTTLVRFLAHELDVPAGRLRVYGTAQRELLGTAGMLRMGDVLYGELWLPLDQARTVRTELEVPGRRGIIRHQHTLTPQPHWTIYWLTIAEPETLRRELSSLDPWRRGVRAAFYRAAGVRGNPLSRRRQAAAADHMTTLRLAVPARDLESDLGIPTSPLALTPSLDHLDRAAVTALAGSGVRVVGILEPDEQPIRRLELPGTATLPLIATPALGDPGTVGFGAPVAQMVARIERWLTTTAALEGTGFEAHAVLVVGNDPTDAPAFLAAAQSWNSRFAAPRFVIGADPEPFQMAVVTSSTVQAHVEGRQRVTVPDSRAGLLEMHAARQRMSHDRATGIYAPLIYTLGGARGELEVLIRGIAPQFPGTVVLNTSPLPRTDVIQVDDGRTEIVTDIPGLGYAFVISPAIVRSAVPETTPHQGNIAGRHFRLTVDSATGAIARLLDTVGRQWVRQPGGGLNGLADAELESLVTEVLPNVGTRTTAYRRLRRGGILRSMYTVYDSLPWLDIENLLETASNASVEYHFSFPFPDATVSWERPLGAEVRQAPVSDFEHLRWVQLEHGGRAVLFRGYDTPTVLITQRGTLINVAPPGVSRFRVHLDGERSMAPWRFGWYAEPLLALPAQPGGTGLLPSVGSLFMVDQEDAAVLGVKLADDGDGAIVYIQDHLGEPRLISLQPGLLRFQEARRVDFVERDRGPVDGTLDEGILVRLPAHGIVALRLRGLWLAGA